jgi:hypothetical protein
MVIQFAQRAIPGEIDAAGQLDDGAQRHLERVAPLAFRRLSTPDELDASYRLRGRIVLGKHWAEELPDGRDRDEYDRCAVHVGGWSGATLVATGRLVFPAKDRLLPTEAAFGVRFPDQDATVEIGRVIVDSAWSDAESTVLLALIGAMWRHAEGRLRWAGANSAGVIRTYRRLGARHDVLGTPREHHGEWRYPVVWKMEQFAPSFRALAFPRG